MIRLNGKVEKLTEQKKWIDRIFEENMSMNDVYPRSSRYILEPFMIQEGQLEFFDLSTSPIFRESFCIGNSKINEQGFKIIDLCIGWEDVKNIVLKNVLKVVNPMK